MRQPLLGNQSDFPGLPLSYAITIGVLTETPRYISAAPFPVRFPEPVNALPDLPRAASDAVGSFAFRAIDRLESRIGYLNRQRPTILSSGSQANKAPSGLNATVLTAFTWPFNHKLSRPVGIFA